MGPVVESIQRSECLSSPINALCHLSVCASVILQVESKLKTCSERTLPDCLFRLCVYALVARKHEYRVDTVACKSNVTFPDQPAPCCHTKLHLILPFCPSTPQEPPWVTRSRSTLQPAPSCYTLTPTRTPAPTGQDPTACMSHHPQCSPSWRASHGRATLSPLLVWSASSTQQLLQARCCRLQSCTCAA